MFATSDTSPPNLCPSCSSDMADLEHELEEEKYKIPTEENFHSALPGSACTRRNAKLCCRWVRHGSRAILVLCRCSTMVLEARQRAIDHATSGSTTNSSNEDSDNSSDYKTANSSNSNMEYK